MSISSALNEVSLTHLIASRYCAPFSLRTFFLSYLLDTYNEWKFFLKEYSYFVQLKACNKVTFDIGNVFCDSSDLIQKQNETYTLKIITRIKNCPKGLK